MITKLNPIRNKRQPTSARRNNSQIFVDKIVDKRTEPTLFNIESARVALMLSTGPYTSLSQMRTSRRDNRRNIIAAETLHLMNVGIVDIQRDFSLLEADSDKTAIKNKNIMDRKDFQNTINEAIATTDKFIAKSDPFFQLDDDVNSLISYKKTKSDITGEVVINADVSYITSNMTILNQSGKYFGKNKYFKE
jgi:hypothetical protein|tara:strand:+ start:600 stop:1175 length:576 start_codon:yes stop_codon:yes gene_type:complete